MRPNRVKQMWRDGEMVRTAWQLIGHPMVAELLARTGYDAIIIDMQHGCGLGPEAAVEVIRAINLTETVPFVRVPWNDPVHLQYVLDAGAGGVIVPLVNTPEDARRAAGACRYPPLGSRSLGPNRAALDGIADYVAHANDEIACLVMIEHIDAVERIEEIAAVPGIDGFFIGPSDLALSLGLSPLTGAGDPAHNAACRRVRDVARARNLAVGIATSGPEDARRRFAEGYNFGRFGSDWGFLVQGRVDSLAATER